METKEYIKNVYSKHWLSARDKIGFTTYDKNICKLILDKIAVRSKILEVDIGTGYPDADFLYRKGFDVSGVEISEVLVETARKNFPNINTLVGDAEDIPFPNDSFDFTYCLSATCYFPNLIKAIDEMLRVTNEKGAVLFDIFNRDNAEVELAYHKRLSLAYGWRKYLRYLKNIAKIILRKGIPNWNFMPVEVPTYPKVIIDFLELKSSKVLLFGRKISKQSEMLIEIELNQKEYEKYERLIFIVYP